MARSEYKEYVVNKYIKTGYLVIIYLSNEPACSASFDSLTGNTIKVLKYMNRESIGRLDANLSAWLDSSS